MRKLVGLALLLCGIGTGWTAEPQRWTIRFRQDMRAEEWRQYCASQGLKIVDEIAPMNMVLVEQAGVKSMAYSADSWGRTGQFSTMAALQDDGKVEWAEEDEYIKWIESEPLSFQQAELPSLEAFLQELRPLPLQNESAAQSEIAVQEEAPNEIQWGVERIHAAQAWARTRGSGVKVAVVDTGIDPDHPDLKGRVAGGYDARKLPDILRGNKNWKDDHGHGTHVAGIISAQMNGFGVVGVAPDVKLYSVKVLDAKGSGTPFTVAQGIVWCAMNGIQVANLSLGSPKESKAIRYAVWFAKEMGVTLVVAAGNRRGFLPSCAVSYPAAYDEAIAVSASDKDDSFAFFSCKGPQVDLIAPGVRILSTVLAKTGDYSIAYAPMSGTSMATPHVAGLAALAIQLGARGPEGVRKALLAVAEPIPGLSKDQQGYGLPNAAKLAGMGNLARK